VTLPLQPRRLSVHPSSSGSLQADGAAANATPVSTVGRQVPALDGVRGLAVILVMAFHIWRSPVTALGWSGVDLFFVLSGYLITGILWDTRSLPGHGRAFYVRRALRILPLYYGVLVVVFIVRPLLGWSHRLDDVALRPEQIWYWTYLCDWRIALGHPRAFTFLTHFWSLSIEEQFYLIWPLVVWRCSRRRSLAIATGLVVAAFALRIVLVARGMAGIAYGLLPCRADALAAGAIVALAVRGPDGAAAVRRWLLPAATLSLVMTAALVAVRPTVEFIDPGMVMVGYSTLDWTFAGLVFVGGTMRSDLLELPLLRAAGRYSYGLYVFHPMVMWWITRDVPILHRVEWRFVLGSALGSVLAAWVSYQVYESRFLHLKERWARLVAPMPQSQRYGAAA
jgi:peptidoglycan/LPS O-acetylase OafA/YrhL